MDDNEDILSRDERRELQEDTVRIQEALAAASGDSDSEDDDGEQYMPFRPLEIELNPEYISDDSQSAHGSAQPDASRQASVPLRLTFQGQLDVDDDTCLQLNRSYQAVIMQSQRCIELVIAQNRERQSELEEELQSKVDRSSESRPRKPVTIYSVPYFKDVNQVSPPDNDDVKRKKEAGEVNTNSKVLERAWYGADKIALKKAVREDSMKRKMQPLLSRKEVLCERLKRVEDGPEKDELEMRIKNTSREIEHTKQLPDFDLFGQIEDSDKVDWLKIAAIDINGRHSAINCELYWRHILHPLVNNRFWTKEEDGLLWRLVHGQTVVDWQWVSKRLKTGRAAYVCLQRYQQIFNEEIAVSEWTTEEDQLLLEVVNMCKVGEVINWAQVNYYLEGHDGNDCRRRYFKIKPDLKRGRFSLEEDEKIVAAVKKFGQLWQLVATEVPGRSGDQCRERWSEALSDDVRKEPFTYQEDRIIWLLHNTPDPPKWSTTAKMIKRTDAQVMRRFLQMKNYEELNTHINRGMRCSIQDLENKRKRRNNSKGILCDLSLIGSEEESPYSSVEAFLNSTIAHLDQSKVAKKREDEVMMNQDLKAGVIIPRPPSYTHKRHYRSVNDHRELVKDIIRAKAAEMQLRMPNKSIASVFTPANIIEKLPEHIQRKIFAKETLSRKRDIHSISKAINQLADSTRPWLPGRHEKDKEETEIDEQLSFIFNSTFIQKGKLGRRSYKVPVTEEQADFQMNQAMALYIKTLDVDMEQAKASRDSMCDIEGVPIEDETPSTSREGTDSAPVDQSNNQISLESTEGDAVPGEPSEAIYLLREALRPSESESCTSLLDFSPSKRRRLVGQPVSGTPRCPVKLLDRVDAAAKIVFDKDDQRSIMGTSLPPSLTSVNAFRHMLLQRRLLGTQQLAEDDVKVLRSTLPSIRDSATYQMLKQRFHSAFLWPAILSNMDMGCLTSKTTTHNRRRQYKYIPVAKRQKVSCQAVTTAPPSGNSGKEDAGDADMSGVPNSSMGKTRTRQVKRVQTYSEEVDARMEKDEKRRQEQRVVKANNEVFPFKMGKRGRKRLNSIQAGKDAKRRRQRKMSRGHTMKAPPLSSCSDQMESAFKPDSSTPGTCLENGDVLEKKKSEDSNIRAILNSTLVSASTSAKGNLNAAVGLALSSTKSKQVAVTRKVKNSIQPTAQPNMKHKAIVLKLPASSQPFQMSSDVLNQLIASAGLGLGSGPLLPSGVSFQLPACDSGSEKKEDNGEKADNAAQQERECSSEGTTVSKNDLLSDKS